MRSHRRRGPLQHILVAGDIEELATIQSLLLVVPDDVYGQVFLEVPHGTELPVLTTPPRVTVTRLTRGPAFEAGDLLTVAVHAWLAEWTPEQPDLDREFTLWVGASTQDRVDALGATLDV